MSCAKTSEPIEMPFGLWTRVGPDPEKVRVQMSSLVMHSNGANSRSIVKYREYPAGAKVIR